MCCLVFVVFVRWLLLVVSTLFLVLAVVFSKKKSDCGLAIAMCCVILVVCFMLDVVGYVWGGG